MITAARLIGDQHSSSQGGIRRSWGITIIGAVVPFLVGFSFGYVVWDDSNVALVCGLALTATAVSLTMIALKCEGLATSKPAIGIMTAAVLDDIASLALVGGAVAVLDDIASLALVGGVGWSLDGRWRW